MMSGSMTKLVPWMEMKVHLPSEELDHGARVGGGVKEMPLV